MICAWNELLCVLPVRLRQDVDRQGREIMRELRLRLGRPPELVCGNGSRWLTDKVTADDLKMTINLASQYSPWTAETVADGFLTIRGGHRIGICGETAVSNNQMLTIREPTSLCLRVARDFPGIAADVADGNDSILIIGRPGAGKTTFLRDLIRQISDRGCAVSVVDERRELFPSDGCFFAGKRTDILSGCRKNIGIETVLRAMGPAVIAVDEITAVCDCKSLLQAGRCGTRLLATAHAADLSDLNSRPIYQLLQTRKLFDRVITLQPGNHWKVERMMA